jgi:hypothetical protein
MTDVCRCLSAEAVRTLVGMGRALAGRDSAGIEGVVCSGDVAKEECGNVDFVVSGVSRFFGGKERMVFS